MLNGASAAWHAHDTTLLLLYLCMQIKRMDMEARSLAPDKSRALLNKVREYKADLQSLKEQLKQAAAGETGSVVTWHVPHDLRS